MGVHNDAGNISGGNIFGFDDRHYVDAEIKKSLEKDKTYTNSKVGTGLLLLKK